MAYPSTQTTQKVFGPYNHHLETAAVAVANAGGTLSIEHLVDGDPDQGTARWNVIDTLNPGDAKQIMIANATFRATPSGGAEYSWSDGQ